MKKALIIGILILFVWHANAGGFIADTIKGCLPGFIVTFTDTTANATTWEWDFGDGSTKTYTNPSPHTYSKAGNFTVTCKVSFPNGSSQIFTKTNFIKISGGPNVSFYANKTQLCPWESIQFTSVVSPGGNSIKSYLWNFGDGNTSTSSNPSYTYFSFGQRTVSLTVIDTMGCHKDTIISNYIQIYTTPTINFTASDSVFCADNNSVTKQVTFSNQSDSTATSFYWDFGDGTNSTLQQPSTKTYGVGFYSISLIAENKYGCKDTLTKAQYIAIVLFQATFTCDSVLCGLNVSPSIAGTGYGANRFIFKIIDSDGVIIDEQTGKNAHYKAITKSGRYDVVSIQSSIKGCSDTLYKSKAIWVFDDIDPVIYIHDTDHCNPNATIHFQNLTPCVDSNDLGLSNTTWDFGDGSVNTQGDSVTHCYGSYGSFTVRAWSVTCYGCQHSAYVQQIDIYKMSAIAYQVVPDIQHGEPPGGCFPHFVAMYADSIISSSPVIDFIWDWGETEIWGSGAAPDTTHSGGSPIGFYTYDYDTGLYIVNLILTNQQGCHDTVEAFATIPVGYPPLCDWFFSDNRLCKSALTIIATAYDSLNSSDSSLVARTRANRWEWYDPQNNLMAITNPANLSPIDTGWLSGYCLIPFHNDCPGQKVCKDSLMYSCPPMAGIAYPAPDSIGNPPVYCNWPLFGFDGGDGQKTKAWDSCVWRLGNYYHDSNGIFHPQTLILPNASFPQGQIAPIQQYEYDTLGGIKMLTERGGHIFVSLWVMNDNRNGNNSCGYCEDSTKQEIIISIANMKLRATDPFGNLVSNVCEDQEIYFYDSTYATDGIYFWGLSMDRTYNGGTTHFSTKEMINHMGTKFTHPNASKFIFDTTNYIGSHPFKYEFNDWGIYTIYLIDSSAAGCGMNSPKHPPFLDWQSNWGNYIAYENRCDTIQINVNPRSVPDFSSNSPVCLGDTLEFNDESFTSPPFSYYKITDYLWNTGGHTDTAKNAKYVFNNLGLYNVSLTITNEKGCDSTGKFPNAITILGVKASFRPQKSIVCNKEPVSFINASSFWNKTLQRTAMVDANTSGLSYYWNFDGQGIITARNAQFAFNVPYSKYVYITLTVLDADGCSNSFTDSIWVIRPVADFSSSSHQAACPALGVQFQNHSYGIDTSKSTFQWIFGDTLSEGNNTSLIKSPYHAYNFAGTFDVILIVTDEHACTDTLLKPQYVEVDGPYGTFSVDTTSGCLPLTVIFYFNLTHADSLFIYYGDGHCDTAEFLGAPFNHTYMKPGLYFPYMLLVKWVYNSTTSTLERCAEGFFLKDSIWVIRINPDFNMDSLYCKGIPITFNNLTDTLHQNILPTAAKLDFIYWNYGNQLNDSTLFNGFTQYNTAGKFTVSLQVKSKLCRATFAKDITVMEFPSITSTPDSAASCVGMDVILTADSLLGEESCFSWIFNDFPDTLTGNPVSHYFDKPGIHAYPYKINVTFSPDNCYKTYFDTLTVSAWTPPLADFKIEDTDGVLLTDAIEGIKAGNNAFFSDQSVAGNGTIIKWLWLFGDDYTDTSGANVIHAYTTKSGYITVTMGVSDEYGCSDTATHQILILESLKFPNIFSPNGDGINDKFEPWDKKKSGYYLSFEMEIYNKWGALVWKRNCESPNCPNYEDENFWWNGTNNQGNNVPEGVYYWVVSAKPESEKADFILNGSITLVR